MEERQVIRSYKFGVTYLGPDQSTEEEMFSNKTGKHCFIILACCMYKKCTNYTAISAGSPAFKEFLQFLGETIELRGWKGYRAGLDVQQGNTGAQSVYTKWQGYEIMFHVSTMLPYVEADRQQLERKRHIGNDIVIVIFSESKEKYQLQSISSKQNRE